MSALQLELLESPISVPDAVTLLASVSPEARGAVHTKPEVAEFILDLSGWKADQPLETFRLLEPSVGEGDFLIPAVERLLSRVEPDETESLKSCIRAVEINSSALAICRTRLTALLQQHGWSATQSDTLLDTWLIHADFLTVPFDAGFSHVVGNPPYVRLEDLPKELLKFYRSKWRALYDRADLYVAFIEKSLELLDQEGRLGFICADRWMKNRYGGPLRSIIGQDFHLDAYVDFTGCPAFLNDVNAYPAVTLIRRGKGARTRVSFRPKIDRDTLIPLASALSRKTTFPSVTTLSGVVQGDQPWMFDEDGCMDLIRKLESRFPLMEAAGCRVGIGVATGADAVFIGTDKDLNVEAERKLPLVTTKDIRNGKVEWGGSWVLNPFKPDGGIVDLDRYPKFRAYVEKHRTIIGNRNVAGRNPHAWFRTIDRIHAALTHVPKLLIPDIKGSAHVVYEGGKYYPHHNLYYVTSDHWNLRALQVVLGSRVGRAFVAAYGPRMRGDFLRFQAQYLRRICLPEWQNLNIDLQELLREAATSNDSSERDRAVRLVYGLSSQEWERLLPSTS